MSPQSPVNPLVRESFDYVGAPKSDGADNHAFEPRRDLGQAEDILMRGCNFYAAGASEAVKLSLARRVRIVGGLSRGGVEDCVDIVRGSDIAFIAHQFERGGAKRDVTIKGGAQRVLFYKCPGLRKIQIGDYTKYDARAVYPDGREVTASPFRFARPGVRAVQIVPADGEPYPEVVVWHGERPEGGPSRRVPTVVTRVYFWARARFWSERVPAADFGVQPWEL